MIVTIDGPAGSGKSTVSRMLAKKIDAKFLDTGAMYRAVTLAALEKETDLTDQAALLNVLKETNFEFRLADDTMQVKIDGKYATEQIRSPRVTANAKFIANAPGIRAELVNMQRNFAKKHQPIVTEGRDQGTAAFPDAEYKFFLIADPMERAKRRHAELAEKGIEVDINELAEQINKRDHSDRNRTDGPLVAAEDAIQIDSTSLDAEGVVNKMLEFIK